MQGTGRQKDKEEDVTMKVKAVEIARTLGLSRAAVSLALNGKPGVSEETRKAVLECRERLENQDPYTVRRKREEQGILIKLVMANRRFGIKFQEVDLWTDVKQVFDSMAKAEGYTLGISYFDIDYDSKEALTKECNSELVAGVILFGTELRPKDSILFEGIRKPLVVYDSDLYCDRFPRVTVNNKDGVRKAVQYLVSHQIRDICYLANSVDIYNMNERRKGFREVLEEYAILDIEKRIIRLGENITEIYEDMRRYLETNPLPQAFIMESCHVSVSVLRVLREEGIRIPEDVSLIGIDELPGYAAAGYDLTSVRIPHSERAWWVMTTLFKEMRAPEKTKASIEVNCQLIEGKTVKIQ